VLLAPAERFQKESREHILVVLGADFEIPMNIPQALYRRASFGAIEAIADQIDQRLPSARQAGMSLRHQFRVPIQGLHQVRDAHHPDQREVSSDSERHAMAAVIEPFNLGRAKPKGSIICPTCAGLGHLGIRGGVSFHFSGYLHRAVLSD
jgi:hypothetical protein